MYCGIGLAKCDVQAVKSKPLYWKIYSIHQTDLIYLDIWRSVFQQCLNVLNALFFIVVMHVTFQNNLSMLR